VAVLMKTPKPQLKSLQPLIDQGCCLLQCGANKNPLIKSWPSSEGLLLAEIGK